MSSGVETGSSDTSCAKIAIWLLDANFAASVCSIISSYDITITFPMCLTFHYVRFLKLHHSWREILTVDKCGIQVTLRLLQPDLSHLTCFLVSNMKHDTITLSTIGTGHWGRPDWKRNHSVNVTLLNTVLWCSLFQIIQPCNYPPIHEMKSQTLYTLLREYTWTLLVCKRGIKQCNGTHNRGNPGRFSHRTDHHPL